MNPIRELVERALEGTGAFLRCDRGEGLYVTNLPAKTDDCTVFRHEMERAGIRAQEMGALLRLTPEARWAEAFAAWAAPEIAPGELTRQLEKTRGRPICPEETACWLEGMKRLELGDAGDYERTVRQAAAAALRKKGGGLLFACGMCLDMMKRQKAVAERLPGG